MGWEYFFSTPKSISGDTFSFYSYTSLMKTHWKMKGKQKDTLFSSDQKKPSKSENGRLHI
jgi:hypothetical protein